MADLGPSGDGAVVFGLDTPRYQKLAVGSMLLFVVLVAGLALVADGVARPVLAVMAIVLAVGAVYVIRALGCRRIVLDGRRIGWCNGLRSDVHVWTDLDRVQFTTRNSIGPAKSPSINLVLWSSSGGMGPVTGLLSQMGLGVADRAALQEAEQRSGKLRPFVIPLTDLGPENAAIIERVIGGR